MSGSSSPAAEAVQRLSARAGRTEADIQSDVRMLLLTGELNLEDPEVHLEAPAPNRCRIDIEVGRAVIECKRDLRVGNVRREAIGQLHGYVEERTRELGQRYAGLLTDGVTWELYHLDQSTSQLRLVSAFELLASTPPSELLVWLEAVLSTADLLQPTPIEVRRKLGAESPGFQLDLAELSDIYSQCKDDSEVRTKRDLWARLLSAALGNQFDNADELFIEHTYLVLTAEAIAHALMGFDLRGSSFDVNEMVTGEIFRQYEIGGVVDADFFDWPTELEQGRSFVKGLAARLARFDWSNVEHDVLKVLYESVIDTATRHRLGEYYTPDWLAELMVSDVVDDPLNQRVLDPSCGSGTFLFWAVRRFLDAADEAALSNADAIAGVSSQVFGIDLHPVAVTLARVTYLLAIGTDRLRDRPAFSVPVYLGDSIQLSQRTSVWSSTGISIKTTEDWSLFDERTLDFPEGVLGDVGRFDQLVAELAHKASNRVPKSKPPGIKGVLDAYKVDESDREEVTKSFKTLCDLHDNRRNHIWGYYVRNLARPIEFTREAQRVDRLVGNPPWLKLNAMPPQTRAEFSRLSKDRNVWASAQVVTSLDLAGLFVVRACELYLKSGGKFGFVMPGAALSRPQYSGFRGADYAGKESQTQVQFETPWELSGVDPQPFPVPACVVFGSRATPPQRMPSEARWWSGKVPDHYRSWSVIGDLLEHTDADVVVAGSTYASPYAELVRQGANLVPRFLLCVVEQPEVGLGMPHGKRAVVSDRTCPEKEPWKSLPSQKGIVEEDFLRPVALGETVLPFRTHAPRTAVVPVSQGKLLDCNSPELSTHKGLADWWLAANATFDAHKSASTKLTLDDQVNYQSKLAQQFPVSVHRVAYTGRGEKIAACRVLDRDLVIDHALYWLAVQTAEEALYLCGVLNSPLLQARVEGALSKGLFGGRNIHRAPFRLGVPAFDPANELHGKIAECSTRAETLAGAVDLGASRNANTNRTKVRRALRETDVLDDLDRLVAELLDQSSP